MTFRDELSKRSTVFALISCGTSRQDSVGRVGRCIRSRSSAVTSRRYCATAARNWASVKRSTLTPRRSRSERSSCSMASAGIPVAATTCWKRSPAAEAWRRRRGDDGFAGFFARLLFPCFGKTALGRSGKRCVESDAPVVGKRLTQCPRPATSSRAAGGENVGARRRDASGRERAGDGALTRRERTRGSRKSRTGRARPLSPCLAGRFGACR